MHPLRLSVQGFTAFSAPQEVDFTGRHLFAITGPTGAGKSSLLDAITWALYGEVPRVGTATKQLISHGAKSMAVLFEFEARGERYRVARHAPAVKGTRIERFTADGWVLLADKAKQVTAHVVAILGLDYATFTKTVLLPQGELDEFLRGEPKVKHEILNSLLGLEVYQRMMMAANNRAAGAQSAAGALQAQRAHLAEATPARVALIEAELTRLSAQAAALDERGRALSALAALAAESVAAEQAVAAARNAAQEAADAVQRAADAAAAAEQRRAEAGVHQSALVRERAALEYDAAVHAALRQQQVQLAERIQAIAAVSRASDACRSAADAVSQVRDARDAAERSAQQAAAHAGEAERARTAAAEALRSSAAAARVAQIAARAAAQAATTDRDTADAALLAAERGAQQVRALAAQWQSAQAMASQASTQLAVAHTEREVAAADAAHAEDACTHAEAALTVAREALDQARTLHAAHALRLGLRVGDPCPVCGEPIAQLSEMHEPPDLDRAMRAAEQAERQVADARTARARAHAAAATASAQAAVAEQRAADAQSARAEAERALITAYGAEAVVDVGATVAAVDARVVEARATLDQCVQRVQQEQAAERAMALALAALPPEVREESPAAVPVTSEGERDTSRLIEEMERSLRRYREAIVATTRAADTQRDAGERVRLAAQAVANQDALAVVAEEALRAAERHLEALPPGTVDADALRRDVAAMDARAADAERLDGALIAAAAAVGEAQVLADAARAQQLAALASQHQRADAERMQAEQAGAVRAQFERSWYAIVGAETTPVTGGVARLIEDHHREALASAQAHGNMAAQLEAAHRALADAQRLDAEIAGLQGATELSRALGQELKQSAFVGYVQQEALRVLAADAAEHLSRLTRGRYRLLSVDDEFLVVDRLNGDEQRSVRTLSGGETFLASLALSLALSERLPELAGAGGAISLESLFIDEGFGSLDAESLDVAIEGLEMLASTRRVIGVISHVPEVAERIADRIEIVRGGGASVVSRASAAVEPADASVAGLR